MDKSIMSTPSPSSSTQQDGKKEAIVDQAKLAVSHVVSDVAGQAREQVNTQFDTRKDKAVETMGNVASAIRDTSEKLKGVGPLGDVAGRAADGIESVAEFFEGKQITDVVRDVERFARREPALFLGAALALGVIGGRFLKSSGHRDSGGMEPATAYPREPAYASSYGYAADDYLGDEEFQEAISSRPFAPSVTPTTPGMPSMPVTPKTSSAAKYGTGTGTGSGSGNGNGGGFV